MLNALKRLAASTTLASLLKDESGMFNALVGFMAYGDGTVGTPSPASSGYVLSVQNVAITIAINTTSNTATISGVSSRAFILFQGYTTTVGSAGGNHNNCARVELTNTTTVTAYIDTSISNQTTTVYAQVVDCTSSLITSIQTGTISVTNGNASNTASVSAVTNANTAVHYLGATNSNTSNSLTTADFGVSLSGTTVTATRVNSTGNCTVGYIVIEFAAGALNSSTQQGTINITGASTSNTATVSSVTTNNSIVVWGGSTCNTTSNTAARGKVKTVLTNATTVTSSVNNGTTGASSTGYFTVVEFASAVVGLAAQRGSITLSSQTSNTATITSVNTTVSLYNWNGYTDTAGNTTPSTVKLSMAATNATTVTANAGASASGSVGYEVIQLS